MKQPYIEAQKRKKEQLEQAIKNWPKAQKLMNKMYNKDTTIRGDK